MDSMEGIHKCKTTASWIAKVIPDWRVLRLDRDTTVGGQLAAKAGGLAGSELGHAAIVGVVHVVV